MDILGTIEQTLDGLVDDIQNYRSPDARADAIIQLDNDMVAELRTLQEHYELCRKIEQLEETSRRLDKGIESALIGLAHCRKQLESAPPGGERTRVPVAQLLNYATKISKFTHKQQGAEAVLPWPTEDSIRRGMIAQLSSGEPEVVEEEVEEEAKPEVRRVQQQAQPVKKINLDLFDSDDD